MNPYVQHLAAQPSSGSPSPLEFPEQEGDTHTTHCACGNPIYDARQQCCLICLNHRPSNKQHHVLAYSSVRHRSIPPSSGADLAAAPRSGISSSVPSSSRPRATFTTQGFSHTLASPDGGDTFYPRSSFDSDLLSSTASANASSGGSRRHRLRTTAAAAAAVPAPFPSLARDSSTSSSSTSGGGGVPSLRSSTSSSSSSSSSSTSDRASLLLSASTDYAPMAAGFARLSRRSVVDYHHPHNNGGLHHPDSAALSRGRGRTLSSDLGARMFDGAD